MTTYIPTSASSQISSLTVRPDGSGVLTYLSGSTCEVTAVRVNHMIAAAAFQVNDHVELNRVMAFELIRAATELAASPNDIELVDAVLAAAKAIERTVYGG